MKTTMNNNNPWKSGTPPAEGEYLCWDGVMLFIDAWEGEWLDTEDDDEPILCWMPIPPGYDRVGGELPVIPPKSFWNPN